MVTKTNFRMIVGSPVNIMDYGAIGDGVNDDTSAIQAAINAANTSRNAIFIPSGVFRLTGTITLPFHELVIFGDSRELSQLIWDSNTGTCIDLNERTRITIRDLRIDSPDNAGASVAGASPNTTSIAIDATKTQYCRFENLYIRGFHYGVTHGTDSWVAWYEGCYFYHNDFGIQGDGEFNMISVQQCVFNYCDRGLWIGGGRGVFINNNWIELCNVGIHKEDYGSLQIENNYIERHNTASINIDYGATITDSVVIRNNAFLTVKENFSEINFHGDEYQTNIVVCDNDFRLVSSVTKGTTFALLGTDNTRCRVFYENNHLFNMDKIAARESELLKNSQTRSIYDDGIYKFVSTVDNVLDLSEEFKDGATYVKVYHTGAANSLNIKLPDMSGKEFDHKPFHIYTSGGSTGMQFSAENGVSFSVDSRSAYSERKDYEQYRLVFTGINGGTQKWDWLD